MNKIKEAVGILSALGLPKAQVNDRGALTLLALLDLKEDSPWSEAELNTLGVHDILQFSKINYQREYAENSRETFRRFTLHQFIHAGLVVSNIDRPDRSTNSPDNNYTITSEALEALCTFGTEEWPAALELFCEQQGRLVETYDPRIRRSKIKLELDGGKEIELSPGSHNELQKDIIIHFRQHFAPHFKVLYIGDTTDKMLHLERDELEKMGVPITKHDKLPDVILYDVEKNVLLLIEAVTSHGPVTPKRRHELEEILASTQTKRAYISAFPTFKEYKKYVSDIAWETDVWIASDPMHMIHKNGEKFLSLYD